MKNSITLITASVLSSICTLGIYKNWIESPVSPVRDVIIKENYSQLANYPSSNNFYPNITNVSSFKEVADLVRPTVVHIKCSSESYDSFFGSESSGSGVIVTTDGFVVTNNHVISGAKKITVTLNNKRTYPARVIGFDKRTDLALLKINKKALGELQLPPLEFGDSDHTHVGEWVLAVGNPFNLTSTVTAGIVSAKGRNIDILESNYSIESFIQTDAVVNPGNSGGALVNTTGELVGINTAIMTRSGGYQGYSFAIPSNLVKKIVKDFIEYGKVQRGFLGISLSNISNEIAKKNKLKSMNGIYLQGITEESAADIAGLQKGDIIIKLNNVAVNSAPELQEQVGLFRPGEKITFMFWRDGELKSTEVILRNEDNTTELDSKRLETDDTEVELLDLLGLEASTLSFDQQKKLNASGVIITKVIEDSHIAKNTTMKENFIVTSVNDEPIQSLEQFIELIEAADSEIVLDGFYEEYKEGYSYIFDKN